MLCGDFKVSEFVLETLVRGEFMSLVLVSQIRIRWLAGGADYTSVTMSQIRS